MDGSVYPNSTDGKKIDCILDLDSQMLNECHTVQFANALDSKGEYCYYYITSLLVMYLWTFRQVSWHQNAYSFILYNVV